MFIFGIETSSSLCSLCFWKEGEVLYEQNLTIGHGHASVFFEALEPAQPLLKKTTHIAVNRGPGSFTGIRVGLSIAKGLHMAGNLPLLGLTSFDVAWHALGHPERALILFDTKRNDFYGALYDAGQRQTPSIFSKKQVSTFQKTNPAAPIFCDVREEGFKTLEVTARQLCEAAHDFSKKNPSLFSPDPFYLRPPKVYE